MNLVENPLAIVPERYIYHMRERFEKGHNHPCRLMESKDPLPESV